MDDLNSQSNSIYEEVFSIVKIMEGGISLEEAWNLTYQDRKVIVNMIEKINKAREGK